MPPKPSMSTLLLVWVALVCVVFLIQCARTKSVVEALRFTACAIWLCIAILLAIDVFLATALYLRLH